MTPRSAALVAIDAAIAVGAGSATLVDPLLGVAAAGVSPVVAAGAKSLLRRLDERRAVRSEFVLAWVARLAQLAPSELEQRCLANPDLEQLLTSVVDAAEGTTAVAKLVAYAVSMAEATAGTTNAASEASLVKILDDLELPHLELLGRFTLSNEEIFGRIGDAGEFNGRTPESLNQVQVETHLAPDLPDLDVLLAGLQRHGLLAPNYPGTGSFGGPAGPASWHLTASGRALYERIIQVAELLSPTDRSE